jgi:hypothetical protein
VPNNNRPFETARTRRFRERNLTGRDERIIHHIERFGCSVLQIESSSAGPGWSYTVGVHDTCEGPELITVGLNEPTALFLLNEAARRLQAGTDLARGRYREMLGDVECEFRPVDPKWVKHLMGWALWYYEGSEFPVLQAVYPDLNNRFPEEADFDPRFLRPMLQPDAPMTRLEQDFLASVDPESSMSDWKFPDPPHSTAFLSETVYKGIEEITYVSHDAEDGAWQFLGDRMDEGGGPVLTCLHHPIDQDRSLKELADLPLGWSAQRSNRESAWVRREKEPEATSEG